MTIDDNLSTADGIKNPTAWGEVIFGSIKDASQTDRMAVAIYAVYLCDSHIQQLLTVTPKQELSTAVRESIEIIKRKTPWTKLEIATELLNELTLPDEDEDLEEPTHGYPGNWDETL